MSSLGALSGAKASMSEQTSNSDTGGHSCVEFSEICMDSYCRTPPLHHYKIFPEEGASGIRCNTGIRWSINV